MFFDLVHPIGPRMTKVPTVSRDFASQPAGIKVLVFTAFRDTVQYLYRWVAQDSEFVAMLGRVQVIHGARTPAR
jgi:ERCC4-related helicase